MENTEGLGSSSGRSWIPDSPVVMDESASAPEWRKEPRVPLRSHQRQVRVVKILAAGSGVVLLTGMLIWVFTWLNRPKAAGLLLVGAGYQQNLSVPQNVYGYNGLLQLKSTVDETTSLTIWGSRRLTMAYDGILGLTADNNWINRLNNVDQPTAVVFFSVHGGSDVQGAYLLTGDADDRNAPENRVRLKDVLDAFAKLPPSRNKVPILDVTQIDANWPLGMFENNFARELEAQDARIRDIPNFIVLSSSDKNQQSWTSIDWRETAYMHHTIEALRGAAEKNGDGRITALEMHDYVSRAVHQWVWDNRQEVQTPVLLPLGSEGRDRASQIQVTLARGDESRRTVELPPLEMPSEWTGPWQRYRDLATQTPSPSVYAPQLWRQYQAVLLRFDELLRAGDNDNAQDMMARLRDIEQDMNQFQTIDLSSWMNTLTMPSVSGRVRDTSPTWLKQWSAFWNAPQDKYAQAWSTLLATADPNDLAAQQMLRLGVYDLLLRNASELPPSNYQRALTLANVIRDPRTPPPAEIHFMYMLNAGLPANWTAPPAAPASAPLPLQIKNGKSASAPLVAENPFIDYPSMPQNALRLRRLAEIAALGVDTPNYPYSLQVRRWIESLIAAADADRRAGEDLIFSMVPEGWRRTNDLFQSAEKRYRDAQSVAVIIQSAFATRNRVMTMLPYYSRWLADQSMPPNDQMVRVAESQVTGMKQLWADVQQLNQLIEVPAPTKDQSVPPPIAGPADPRLEEIAKKSTAVATAFDKFEHDFIGNWRTTSDVDSPILLIQATHALKVPVVVDPAFRAKIITLERKLSRELLLAGSQGLNPARVLSEEQVKRRALYFGKQEGELAMAALGERWFDECPGPGLEKYVQVQHRLDVFGTDDRWWQSLAVAGEQIGRRWQALPGAIDQMTKYGVAASLPTAPAILEHAASLSRLVDGAGATRLKENPIKEFREWFTRDLVLWQAQRTWEDHWFSLDPSAEPYYRYAGLIFIDDAWRFANTPPTTEVVQAMQKKLNQPGNIAFNGPAQLVATSELRLSADYSLGAASGAATPFGFPTVWINAGDNLQMAFPPNQTRLFRQISADKPIATVTCTLNSPLVAASESNPPATPSVVPTSLSLNCLFRGQQVVFDTPIAVATAPNTIQRERTPPLKGSIAVRADSGVYTRFGSSNAAIAIVLDCSGSMGPADGTNFLPTTKFLEATNALQQVLQNLPSGTTVSIWVFGQSVGPGRTVPAEQTIQQVIPPTAWNPENPSQLPGIMAKVSYPALVPWNETPVVRAMTMAKADLARAPGFKTLLVITDGMDNRFASDTQLNPNNIDIPTYLLETFQNSGIEVNIVGFKVVNGEQEQAKKQFQVVRQMQTPGNWYEVNDTQNLAGTLDMAMRQKLRYWVLTEDGSIVPGCPPDGVEASQIGSNNQWYPGGLAPGAYRLQVKADKILEKGIILARGDLLLVTLAMGPNGLEFQRGVYSRDEFPWKPFKETSGWRLAALQNQLVGNLGMQMLLTLDDIRGLRDQALLQEMRPRRVWYELAPQPAVSTPFTFRWSYEDGYPAPAWNVNVPQWAPLPGTQSPTQPVVSVWWNPNQDTPPAATLLRGNDFNAYSNVINRQIQVDDDIVVIEGIASEEHLVEVRPGVMERRPCLVVRVNHAAGRPVWVQLAGVAATGVEHRYYSGAHKYAGIFWPVTPDDAAENLANISLLSINDFKRTAERRKFSMQLDQLPAPDPNGVRPAQPVDPGGAPRSPSPSLDVNRDPPQKSVESIVILPDVPGEPANARLNESAKTAGARPTNSVERK